MLKRLATPITLALAIFASSASLAQNTTPNVNDPPKPTTPEGQPPNVNQPPAQTPEERQRERQEQRRKEREEAEKNQNNKPATDLPASFHKVTDLRGTQVFARGGEKIGEIKNLAINTDNGRVRYAIVDNGSGVLHPIPMPALKFAPNRDKATVDTTLDRMRDAPKFNPDGWSTIGDAKWGAIVYQFYGIDRDPENDRDRPDFVPGEHVVSAKAQTRQGEGLGSVKNIMIDTDKNAVAYAVLDFGKEGKLFAVPWESMTVKDAGKTVVVRGVDRDDLKDAPGFANSRWPTYKELNWNKDTNFDSKPPNWVYGMKETGGNSAGNGNGSGGDRGAMGGWQTNGKYGQLFQTKRVEKWRGTVVRSESVTPLAGMDPGTALVVKVADQGNMVVHLGPEWFVKNQQEKFAAGDEIDFSGSLVNIEQKPVVMATEVRMQKRVLTLRDKNGVPVWDAHKRQK